MQESAGLGCDRFIGQAVRVCHDVLELLGDGESLATALNALTCEEYAVIDGQRGLIGVDGLPPLLLRLVAAAAIFQVD